MARLYERVGMAMRYVFGMDLSSRKLAIVRLDLDDNNEPTVWTFMADRKEKNRGNVLAHFSEELDSLFDVVMLDEADYVFIEQPVVGRGGVHSTIVQAQVQGVVLAMAVLCGAGGAYPVNVKTWKKDIVGHGGADKDKVRAWLADHHPVLSELAGEDQDLVDASCVALYGKSVIERGEALSTA